MVRKHVFAWGGVIAAAGLSIMAGVALAERAAMQVLNRIGEGRWELREREGGPVRSVCIGDRQQLVQLRHPALACDRLVLEDRTNSLTVQYTCRGRGYGRTHIRFETPQLVQIESQGISEGLPFDFVAEGRYAGPCGG